jgi:hypothetical protein
VGTGSGKGPQNRGPRSVFAHLNDHVSLDNGQMLAARDDVASGSLDGADGVSRKAMGWLIPVLSFDDTNACCSNRERRLREALLLMTAGGLERLLRSVDCRGASV